MLVVLLTRPGSPRSCNAESSSFVVKFIRVPAALSTLTVRALPKKMYGYGFTIHLMARARLHLTSPSSPRNVVGQLLSQTPNKHRSRKSWQVQQVFKYYPACSSKKHLNLLPKHSGCQHARMLTLWMVTSHFLTLLNQSLWQNNLSRNPCRTIRVSIDMRWEEKFSNQINSTLNQPSPSFHPRPAA